MTETQPIRLLLVEDHHLVRESLVRGLNSEPGLVVAGECASVTEALEIVQKTPIDVVLLDLDLGPQEGGAFLNLYKKVGCTAQVLVVTAGVGEREAAWLMKRGCAGIVLKNEHISKLVERIKTLVANEPDRTHDPETEMPAVSSQQKKKRPLTARERAVLRGVCEGLSNKLIGSQLGVTENSIKSMIQQLFTKTGVRTRAQLVRAAIEQYWDELDTE